MHPKEIIQHWVKIFNSGNAQALATLYHDGAINHQVNQEPTVGKIAIQKKFENEYKESEKVCNVDWGILEWREPLGLRGCGFFHILNDKIKLQRGYWDLLSFLRQHKLPLPRE